MTTPELPAISVYNNASKKLCRSLRLQDQFQDQEDTRSRLDKLCYINSDYQPELATPTIEKFCHELSITLQAVHTAAAAQPKHKNFTRDHMIELKETASRHDLDIRNADKNLGCAVMSTSDIRAAAVAILNSSDPKSYKQLTPAEAAELTQEFCDRTSLLLARHGASTLSEMIISFISQKFKKPPRYPDWYLIPKLHKAKIDYRPICPSMHSVQHETSVYLSGTLNPIAQRLPTVLNSTIQFVKVIDTTSVPDDTVMVTADVTALYPSIPTKHGMKVVEAVLRDPDVSPLHNQPTLLGLVLALLRLVLTFNVFKYNGEYWLQLIGTAMGTPAACAYANIFMYGIEISLVSEWIQSRDLHLYLRLIDDVFALLRTAKATLFVDALNKLCPGIAFTSVISKTRVTMLDVEVYRGARWLQPDGRHLYDYMVYQKPHNLYQYICFDSAHPLSVKRALITGELLRYATNSSTPDTYFETVKQFYFRLRARGYPQRFLAQAFSKRSYYDRINAINSYGLPKAEPPRIPTIVLPYAPVLDRFKLGGRIKHLWEATCNTGPAPRIAFSKGQSIYDLIRTLQKRRSSVPDST